MRRKGFTLIELLAVIVILAIIALIAIPLIGNVIEKAKIGALENSVNGLVESANMYYANQTIKGEPATETTFDFANGEQTSIEKLEYKGKVYNGKLILHANGEVAVCIDDKEHYAYKNKNSDEIISGIGTCVYDGTTGDFSSNSSIKDLRGKTVVATNVTQSADGLSTLITIPEEGHYDTSSQISVSNSDITGNLDGLSAIYYNGNFYKIGTLDLVSTEVASETIFEISENTIHYRGNNSIGFGRSVICSDKKISIDKISKIIINYRMIGSDSASKLYFGLFSSKPSSYSNIPDTYISIERNTSGWIEFDVSSVSGDYYIGAYIYGGGSTGKYTDSYIYNIITIG